MARFKITDDYGDPCEFRPRQYEGFTYPRAFDNRFARWVWSRLFCRRGWHLWDESISCESHVLVCDACDVEFGIRADFNPATAV